MNLCEIAQREAGGFPLEALTSAGRFSRSPSWNALVHSARAAGPGRVLFTFGMIILARESAAARCDFAAN